jgi:hypothetical protein
VKFILKLSLPDQQHDLHRLEREVDKVAHVVAEQAVDRVDVPPIDFKIEKLIWTDRKEGNRKIKKAVVSVERVLPSM